MILTMASASAAQTLAIGFYSLDCVSDLHDYSLCRTTVLRKRKMASNSGRDFKGRPGVFGQPARDASALLNTGLLELRNYFPKFSYHFKLVLAEPMQAMSLRPSPFRSKAMHAAAAIPPERMLPAPRAWQRGKQGVSCLRRPPGRSKRGSGNCFLIAAIFDLAPVERLPRQMMYHPANRSDGHEDTEGGLRA